METIFAESTAKGRAGVSVIRISGPRALAALGSMAPNIPSPRQAVLRKLMDPDGALIDEALVLYFAGPDSFTGEDVVELQVHGSIAVVSRLLRCLSTLPDCRPAEPGEFTRRALESGKLDLAQIEGLADLIDAETEAQRKQAVRLFEGALGDKIGGWRGDLIRAAALLEATIDFADEEVPVDVTPEVEALLSGVASDLQREIEGTRIAERIRAGFEVAIIGPPNAGKSTLLNRLAGRAAAITSEVAGTTRDVIEVRMDIDGLAVTLLDTAGLRDADDTVEALGVSLAIERAKQADLRVILAETGFDVPFELSPDDIRVQPKSDLGQFDNGQALRISGKTGDGVDRLITRIAEVLVEKTASAGLATRERHRIAMLDASMALKEANEVLAYGPDRYEFAAEAIRQACLALETILGRIDVENLLDEIFSSFCIGK